MKRNRLYSKLSNSTNKRRRLAACAVSHNIMQATLRQRCGRAVGDDSAWAVGMGLKRQRCSRQGFRSTTALPSDWPRPTADLFVLTHRPICSNGEIFARLCRHRLVCRLHERPRLRDSLIGSTSGGCLFWPVFHGGRQWQRRMLSKREPRACAGDVANRPTARNRGSGSVGRG